MAIKFQFPNFKVNASLAWLQLSKEKPRLLVALSGITFANILMFMQTGFEGALYDSNVRLHESLNSELVMLSTRAKAVARIRPFSSRRLDQALAAPGVEAVRPLSIDYADWRNPETGDYRSLFVIGIDPENPAIDLPSVTPQLAKIRWKNNILFDQNSKREYGDIPALLAENQEVVTEVQDYQVRIAGLFSLGPCFAVDGNILTSDLNFARIFRHKNRQVEHIDLGIIDLKPGVSPEEVKAILKTYIPSDVQIMTKQEFIDFERQYWRISTPIGYIFALGTAMGFVVGTVIVYQVLYTDISSHLAEYATLQAIGYSYRYLLGIVLQEAIILALIGYLPGLTISLGLYQLTKSATFLPMFLPLTRGINILILSILMCSCSGMLAIRKLKSADPATIF